MKPLNIYYQRYFEFNLSSSFDTLQILYIFRVKHLGKLDCVIVYPSHLKVADNQETSRCST